MSDHPTPKMLVQWHLLNGCNLRCSHCYHESFEGEPVSLPQARLVMERMARLRDELREEVRALAFRVAITGGEPLCHPELFDVLSLVRARMGEAGFSLLTNGTLLTPALARELARFVPAFVQVSLDGGERNHDAARGEGNWRRALAGIEALTAARIPTVISFTARRENVTDFPEVAEVAARLGVWRLWAERMVPWGEGAALSEQVLTPQETLAFVEMLYETRKRHLGKLDVSLHRSLQFLAFVERGEEQDSGCKPYFCGAGRTLLAILPEGTVLPCRRLPVPVGNVFEDELGTIRRASPFLRGLREGPAPGTACARCPHWVLCGGGSRCLAHALLGTPLGGDPGCWRS